MSIVPLRQDTEAAIRASINVRAANLEVSEWLRRKWVRKAFDMVRNGMTIKDAIKESIRGMRNEHKSGAYSF